MPDAGSRKSSPVSPARAQDPGGEGGPATQPLLLAVSLAVVLLLYFLARLPALNPGCLYLDDQWVALLVRCASLQDLLRLDPPAPIGFMILLKGIVALFGEGAWQLQALPLACGAAQLLLLGWLAFRLTGNAFTGILAALWSALDPAAALCAVRVKPFTLDALVTTAMLCLLVEILRGTGNPRRRWFWLLACAVCASLVSFTALISGPVILAIAGWKLFVDEPPGRAKLAAGAGAAGYAIVIALLYFGLFREQSSDAMHEYWRLFYLPLGDWQAACSFLSGRGADFLCGAFPVQSIWLMLAILALVLYRCRASREIRAMTITAGALILFALVLAGLQAYPLGGKRTDLYAHPFLHLLAALAWTPPLRGGRQLHAAVTALLFIALAVTSWRTPVAYPQPGDRAAIDALCAEIRADDALLVYPWSNWAVAYYGKWEVELVQYAASTNGYYAQLHRANTLVLAEQLAGRDFRSQRQVIDTQIFLWLQKRPARIYYLATEVAQAPHDWICAALKKSGYSGGFVISSGSALLMRFTR